MKKKQHFPEILFHDILETIDDAVFIVDFEKDKIIYGNEKFYQISDYTAEIIQEKGLTEISTEKTHQTVVESGQSLQQSISFDGSLVTKSGKCFESKWNIRFLNYEEQILLMVSLTEVKTVTKASTSTYGLNPYQKILNYINIGIFHTDLSGRFLYVNQEMAKIVGFYGIDELLTTSLSKIFEDFDNGINISNMLMLQGEIRNIQVKSFKRDKTEYWVTINAVTIRDIKGNPESFLGFVKDVTEQKRVEEALQTNRSNLQAILDNFPFLAWLKDTEGRFITVNKPYAKLCNLSSPIELVGKTDYDTWPREVAEAHQADDREVTLSREHRNFEELIVYNGKEVWFETFKAPLFDVNGSVIGTTGFARNITERKKTEEIIKTNERRFRALVENSADAITMISANGTVLYEGPNVQRITGYDIEKRIGKSGFETVLPEDMPKIKEALAFIISKPGAVVTDIQFRAVRSDNSIWWAEGTATNLLEDPNVQAVVINYHDITARKQVEIQLKQSEEKFSKAFRQSPVMHAISKIDNGNYIDVNDSFLSGLGFKREEVIGQTSVNLGLWDDEADRVRAMEMLKKDGTLRNYELRIRNKKKEVLTALFSAEFVEIGNERCLLSSALDISDRIKAEERLVYFKSAVELSASAIGMSTPDGKHFYQNKAFDNLFGKVGTNPVVPYVNLETGKEVFNTIMNGHEWKGEVEMYSKDKDIRNIILHAYPIKDEKDKIFGLVGVHVDITEIKRVEEELLKSQINLENAQAMIHMGSWELDLQNSTGIWSKEMYKIFRREPDKGVPSLTEFYDYLHPNDRQKIMDAHKSMIEKGDDFTGEFRTNPEHGDIRIILLQYFPKKDKNGKVVKFVGSSRDITDRKKAEEELARSEKQYRLIAENTSDIITIIDLTLNQFIYASPSVSRIRGLSPEQVLAQRIDDSLTPSSIKYFRSVIPQRIEELQKGIIKVYLDDIEQICADGSTIWTETSTHYVIDETTGHVLIYGVSRDITDRKKAEQALKERESNLQKAFEIAAIGQWRYDILNDKFFWSDSSIEVIGFQPDNIPLSYTDFLKFVHPNDIEGVNKAEEHSVISKKFEHEYRLIVNDKIKWVRVKAHVEFDEKGRDIMKIGIIQDITKRKNDEISIHMKNQEYMALNKEYQAQYEELVESLNRIQKINHEYEEAKKKAEESDRLKTAFLANMSHEIRTPMNGILGFTELLKEPKLNGNQQKHYVEVIQKSGQRMLNIINDLIDISKIEAGQTEIYLEETNINQVLENLYVFFKPEAEKRELGFVCNKGPSDVNSIIITDENKFVQVLSNLIKNAMKFTSYGSIEFGYENKTHADSDKYLKFYVKDSGIGIKPELKEKIFERFHQGEMEHSKTYDGAGLGLSISKAFIEMLGGKIWVESEEGKGSVFYFTIPCITTHSKNDDEMESDNKKESFTFSEKTILIAEDDNVSFMFLKEMLKNKGLNIIHVANGAEAIKLVRTRPEIKLVLMDIKMPDMNGLEATKAIKQIRPALPVIAQTAYATPHDEKKCYDSGCNDYISKPINQNLLLKKIAKYLD